MPSLRRARDVVVGAVVVVLLALGGRFSRRAALRGACSALIADGTARLATRGRTPEIVAVARLTGLAAGIGIESPAWSRPLVAGAGAAAIAAEAPRDWRAATVGTGIGFAAASVTLRWWPVASREPARARRVRGSGTVPVGSDGAGLALVVNPNAGPAFSGNPADSFRDAFPAATVLETGDGDDVVELAREAAVSARVLGACGGDGTLNAVAGVALERGLPFFAAPGGTLNHFTRDIGLVTLDDAIDAVRSGRLAEIDVGVLDDRPFLNTASFGGYPELVEAREQLESRIGKWPALAWSLVRVLRGSNPCRVALDGVRRDVWMVFIGNCAYEPRGFAPTWRDRLDDEQLDLRLVDAAHPFSRTRLVLAVLTGTLARTRVYEQRLVDNFDVESFDGRVRLATDGETFEGSSRFTVAKASRRLRLVVPADEDSDRVP